jgi:hypothetical protein
MFEPNQPSNYHSNANPPHPTRTRFVQREGSLHDIAQCAGRRIAHLAYAIISNSAFPFSTVKTALLIPRFQPFGVEVPFVL